MIKINNEKCIGCDTCIDNCEQGAIEYNHLGYIVDPSMCIECKKCIYGCDHGAIEDIPE